MQRLAEDDKIKFQQTAPGMEFKIDGEPKIATRNVSNCLLGISGLLAYSTSTKL